MTSPYLYSRREAVQRMACGVGGLGLAALLADQGVLRAADGIGRVGPPGPHHPPKAKSLIFLNMVGGPSQFETFDYKPEMHRWAGKSPPGSGGTDAVVRFDPRATVIPPLYPYVRSKTSDVATTTLFPHTATVLDELCVVRSMVCNSPAHAPAQRQAMTGYAAQPMPSLGSWLTYGLGSANKNLPAFVSLAGGFHHGSGFLPAHNQGMPVGARMANLKPPPALVPHQRGQLDLLAGLNRDFAARHPGDDPLDARLAAAELAFRMQASCPDAVDLAKETAETLKLYGVTDAPGPRGADRGKERGIQHTNVEFSTMCLIARRLVERGVRVVTLAVGGSRGWDHHSSLKTAVAHNAGVIDRGVAGLLADLRRTGLLDTTLVMWGGEFGRTPFAEGADGRDHFAKGYTYWLAGGGAKRGVYYGETDEIGLTITKNPVHVHDLHATVLHLMGLDPEKLTFRYGGRDQRLTDVNGKVVRGLIA